MRVFFILTIFWVCAGVAYAAPSDVAVSEILFDPGGSTDTGLEYVVIKNFGSADINLSGWDLYPDKAGYFTFPSFNLPAGSSVKVHLKSSGTNDVSNVYQGSGSSSNMGNSSGSVALFSSTTHSADTIVSYVRYHKPGSGESKTWETAAASAGTWTAGTFVDIGSGAEGKTLILSGIAQKNSPTGWQLEVPTESSSSSESSSAPLSEDGPMYSGSIPDPGTSSKIKTYAGADRTVIAGSATAFSGSAEGVDGEPFASTRFLWNFGDGAYAVGQKIEHVFSYPGVYTVSLEVSLGNWSGSDRVEIRAIPNPVFVSEIMPGTDGWIELKNEYTRLLDISGMGIALSGLEPFFFPVGSLMAPHAFVVIPAHTLGFAIPPSGEVSLRYANGVSLSSFLYDATNIKVGESISRSEDSEWVTGVATPGESAQKTIASAKTTAKTNADQDFSQTQKPTIIPAKNNTASALNAKNSASSLPTPWSEYLWLLAGLAIGGVIGGVVLFLKGRFL